MYFLIWSIVMDSSDHAEDRSKELHCDNEYSSEGLRSENPFCQLKTSSTKEKRFANDKSEINFLNQCKLELSAEVIRWKEESLKLQKENQAAVKKIEELQSIVNKLTKKNNDLEKNMLLSWEENKKLKMQTLIIDEENIVLHKKLSKVFNKFHSYPWSELLNKSSSNSYLNSVSYAEESDQKNFKSWEEVSQKLFGQMKQEMKDLQELGKKLAAEEKSLGTEEEKNFSVEICSESDNFHMVTKEAVEHISNLHHGTESLKQHLKEQNLKLQFLLNQFSQDCKKLQDGKHTQVLEKKGDYAQSTISDANQLYKLNNWFTTKIEDKKFVRPSDESFRAYFTQQLNSSKSSEELKKIVQLYLNSETETQKAIISKRSSADPENKSKITADNKSSVGRTSFRTIDTAAQNKNLSQSAVSALKQKCEKTVSTMGERICPICEIVFPIVVSESEFESHVMAHLEAESASLLDKYEIL